MEYVKTLRRDLEGFIFRHPEFKLSWEPLNLSSGNFPFSEKLPEIVRVMDFASQVAGVGPMAAVAGSIAELVGKFILSKGFSREVVVENGGDIFICLLKDAKIKVFAGDSPFSGKIGILISKEIMPCGVCTSSGKVGHSVSFGKAHAVTVIHKSAPVADALATSFGNLLKSPQDFKKVLQKAKKIKDLYGVLAIFEDKLFLWGEKIKILRL